MTDFKASIDLHCNTIASDGTLSPTELVELAISDHSIPILAHPFSLGIDFVQLRELVSTLKKSGLAGIEVFYPSHTEEFRQQLHELALNLDLIETGGSDFHGANKPNVEIGKGINGNVHIKYDIVERLEHWLDEMP